MPVVDFDRLPHENSTEKIIRLLEKGNINLNKKPWVN